MCHILFICVLVVCCIESDEVFVFYERSGDTRYLDTSVELTVRSSVECCVRCQRNQGCRVASYHNTNKICEIGTRSSIKDVFLSDVAGWDMLTLEVACAVGWTRIKTSCYMMSTKLQTWEESQVECGVIHSGGHLADVHSEAVNDLLEILYNQSPVTSPKIWVGAYRDSEGVYKWTDQSHVPGSFQNWISDQPDFYEENEYCMAILADRNFQWNDDDCSNSVHSFCEY